MAKFEAPKKILVDGGKYAYLLVVEPGPNHNKFYEMVQFSAGEFISYYGRVGNPKPQQKIRDLYEWESVMRTRMRHDYVDRTALRSVAIGGAVMKPIQDPDVRVMIEELQKYAGSHVDRNYNVSVEAVTQAMIDQAQAYLDELATVVAVPNPSRHKVNNLLTNLYTVIPRKMKRVRDHMFGPEGITDLKQLMADEQDTLDSLASQVAKPVAGTADKTILDTMGLTAKPVQDYHADAIIKLLRDSGNYRVEYDGAVQFQHIARHEAMTPHRKTGLPVKDLWHGSRNENWVGILQKGLVLRPSNAVRTGAMFGQGLYFADRAGKSLGYTSLYGSYWASGASNVAYLALFEVYVGKAMHIKRHQYSHERLDYQKVRSSGYDSVFAEGGYDLRNNEIIVYQESQCTIHYLVRVRSR